jgi:hypothetical protein
MSGGVRERPVAEIGGQFLKDHFVSGAFASPRTVVLAVDFKACNAS